MFVYGDYRSYIFLNKEQPSLNNHAFLLTFTLFVPLLFKLLHLHLLLIGVWEYRLISNTKTIVGTNAF
jgi:hypothetical protein